MIIMIAYWQRRLLTMIHGSSKMVPKKLMAARAMMNTFMDVRRSLKRMKSQRREPLEASEATKSTRQNEPIICSL